MSGNTAKSLNTVRRIVSTFTTASSLARRSGSIRHFDRASGRWFSPEEKDRLIKELRAGRPLQRYVTHKHLNLQYKSQAPGGVLR
jgi:hypothetical protein